MKNSFWKKLLDLFFPQFCLNCRREGDIICSDCLSLIDVIPYQYCPFCDKPKRVFEKGRCKKHKNHQLNGLFFAAPYQNILLQTMIKKFKYPPFSKELAKPLALLIILHLIQTKNQYFFEVSPHLKYQGENVPHNNSLLLIPIPLYPSKERWRGFNQAALIAKELSSVSKIPLSQKNLVRIKKTKSQTELSQKERKKEIKNAFKIKNPLEVKRKIVFLVDDVFTTGATMEECAKTLKRAGAKQVWGIAVARELLIDG